MGSDDRIGAILDTLDDSRDIICKYCAHELSPWYAGINASLGSLVPLDVALGSRSG